MKKYDFDEVLQRRNTSSVKWDFFNVNEGDTGEILALSIADMDLPCAEPILEALTNRVDKKIFGYSKPDETFYDSIISWHKRRFGFEIEREQMVNSPGVVPALATLVRMLTKEREGVIIQNPVYYPFSSLVVENNRELLVNELVNNDGYYTMDYEDLEEKAKDPNTKMFIFCSPHNPVGRVWTREELQRVIDICIENDVYLVSDEIHCDLVRENVKHTPIGSLTNHEKAITCLAASKSFNLAGLQMSTILLKTPELRKQWDYEHFSKSCMFGSGVFGIEGTKAAYNYGEDWLNQVNEYIDGNLAFVDSFLKEHLPEAIYIIPEGTYFTWIDLRAYGFNAKELEDMMVNKAKLILDEGYIFGKQGEGFERLNVACSRTILEECLIRMKNVILSSMK
ncbi:MULTISPECIES: MalY/PatB family protein [Psychrilyobacter]|uniref:cysteine-S-conjugate beta-lyase n=1 Tax=Psychrilyobacter piezotolerans TaxID=2293438 RepID=A0ABX9KJE0_9FUSO|nr:MULTISPECIES: MalY/PatB family protein [Psychrilyobacter]MCS5423032.1 pyridoxal phosphate-dependent aminotransferase [Psychrilyobacter sp. S5]NDI77203.1 pyridoxal phosphate-dependent aminotransferase [Psychrilyobacter piezotolerans]RDE64193.1 pyridoxal phosphate-dependent aminotransferase [Psychrilyobacter sp. S5]REI42285.1 putative C-S lyase [Psychrilyobacter piezotolerans]